MKILLATRRTSLLWEPRDLWIGVYWTRRGGGLDIYICLLPCFPIKVALGDAS